jgi:hypothetical protein
MDRSVAAAVSDWTMLVYMAGDNNLEGAGYEDLAEMKRVGSTDRIQVVVQMDTERNGTTRYHVERGRLRTLEKLPGVNCGDPRTLTGFLQWGQQRYPARHYLVDIWNHGGGWENLPPDYDYEGIRAIRPRPAGALRRFRRSLFRTTIQKIHRRAKGARAIAIDCGSQDYLDNRELRVAIAGALPPGTRVDVLGCDACLMNMIEIAYELKEVVRFMVGSEETEPGTGWPYTEILQQLAAHPEQSPEDLAKTIVAEYGQWYRKQAPGHEATQSALDLERMPALAEAVSALADALLANLGSVAGPVLLARDRAQKFAMPEYVDLGDWVRQLLPRVTGEAAIITAAEQVLQTLPLQRHPGVVIANAASGTRVRNATGLSIYFPEKRNYAPDYGGLRFSQDQHWRKFLEALFKL